MREVKAFPIAIIDEDYEGKHSAGRGMQQLAAAIEKEGFRVVGGISYKDARRLAEHIRGCYEIVQGAWQSAPVPHGLNAMSKGRIRTRGYSLSVHREGRNLVGTFSTSADAALPNGTSSVSRPIRALRVGCESRE